MAREKGMGNLQREKSGRWTARICVDGKRWSRSTHTTDRAKAERFLQRMLAPLGLGEKTLALGEVWREYEKSPNRRDLAASTMNAKRIVWMHFAEWIEANHLEVTQLAHLTRETVAEYLRVLKIRHSASTYNNRVCVLREICHVLAEQAGVEEDPWTGVRLLTDDSHTRRELTLEELRRVVEAARRVDRSACDSHAHARAGCAREVASTTGEWEMLFLVGIYTGLRLGDCCCLRWCEVNLERGVIQVLPRKVKKHLKGRPVTIPIHAELTRALGAAACESTRSTEEAEYVMPVLAGWYLGAERHKVGYGLEKIFKEAGIVTSVKIAGRKTRTPDATFHSLRHTFVSLSANAGVPLPVVQSIVGHTSTAMTRHYYHENETELRRAVAAIPSLEEMGGGREKTERVGGCRVGCSREREQNGGLESATTRGASGTIGERLRVLEELKASGMITGREYRVQRARILGEL